MTKIPKPRKTHAPNVNSESGQINLNIAAVHEFYTREELKLSMSQRHAERIGGIVGRPAFLIAILLFVAFWSGANLFLLARHMTAFDDPPFLATS